MSARPDLAGTNPFGAVPAPASPPRIRPPRGSRLRSHLPGLALALAVAIVATAVGRVLPIVGGPVAGIVLGVALAALSRPGAALRPGIAFSGRTLLQVSVVMLGTQLSLRQVVQVGAASLPVMFATLASALGGACWIGRRLGIVGDLRTLIGVGTGICGASAIAAVTPVIGAAGADVSYALSTIFLFNVVAVLTFPTLGHLLGLSQHAFGLFAGTAVNDMSSVVAAASTYGSSATSYAVVVKLVRTLLIVPICLGLSALATRRARGGHRRGLDAGGSVVSRRARSRRAVARSVRLVPWFLIGFVLVVVLNSLGLVPARAHPWLSDASVFLITVALSAIGLSTDLAGLRRAGARPLVLGASLWVVVSATSLGLQHLTGTL